MMHGSLFSGIGGFDIAAEWCGWTNAFHCENARFPRRVLQYYFPNAISYDDIRTTDFRVWRGRIDILSGGFPCQPFSIAGKRKGSEDDRYLWPEMLRAVNEIRPTWVVGENVTGLLSMVQSCEIVRMEEQAVIFSEDHETIITEKSKFIIETICEEFEQIGYSIQPIVIPACAVGAPHRRDRVWIIAHRSDPGIENKQREGEDGVLPFRDATNAHGIRGFRRSTESFFREEDSEERTDLQRASERPCHLWTTFDTQRNGQLRDRCTYKDDNPWEGFPTQPPICGGDDGIPRILDSITFPRWRAESIRAYGNAIVPQIAYEIFRIINELN